LDQQVTTIISLVCSVLGVGKSCILQRFAGEVFSGKFRYFWLGRSHSGYLIFV